MTTVTTPLLDLAGLRELQRRMHGRHPDGDEVRWAHTPGRVDFLGVRELIMDWEEFVRRVDTAPVAALVRGARGPRPHVLEADERGRPLLQLEARAVLAPPIHSAFAGRIRRDVSTVERFEYAEHTISVGLRTVYDSPDRPAQEALMTFGCGPTGRLRLELLSCTRYRRAALLTMDGADRCDWLRTRASIPTFSRSLTQLARRLEHVYQSQADSQLA
jgi:hypothetical protein